MTIIISFLAPVLCRGSLSLPVGWNCPAVTHYWFNKNNNIMHLWSFNTLFSTYEIFAKRGIWVLMTVLFPHPKSIDFTLLLKRPSPILMLYYIIKQPLLDSASGKGGIGPNCIWCENFVMRISCRVFCHPKKKALNPRDNLMGGVAQIMVAMERLTYSTLKFVTSL